MSDPERWAKKNGSGFHHFIFQLSCGMARSWRFRDMGRK